MFWKSQPNTCKISNKCTVTYMSNEKALVTGTMNSLLVSGILKYNGSSNISHHPPKKKPLKTIHVFFWPAWKVERVERIAKCCKQFWSPNLLPKTLPGPKRTGKRLPTTNFSGGKLAVRLPGGCFIEVSSTPTNCAKKERVLFLVTLELEIFVPLQQNGPLKKRLWGLLWRDNFILRRPSFNQSAFIVDRFWSWEYLKKNRLMIVRGGTWWATTSLASVF